jgi:branched-chain amino acid transport system ATP-binding protein
MTTRAEPSPQVILRTRGVGKVFGKFTALKNISAEFPKGAITSIIGPNGAGKSTYFNLLSGAYPPTSGKVEFEGRQIVPDHQCVSATVDSREHPGRAAGIGIAV